jgi:hypothetical protein
MRGASRAGLVWFLIVALVTGCGSTSGVRSRKAETLATSTTSTIPASTTTAITTTTVASTDAATTTTSTTLVSEGFQPPCVESQRSGTSAVSLDETGLDVFGPLQSEPAIVVTLPRGVSEFSPDPTSTSAISTRVPGGVLLSVRSSSDGYFPGSMVALIDEDGVPRWVRCWSDTVSGVYVAPASASPTEAIVAANIDQGNAPPLTEYRVISLADGSTQGTLADHLAAQGVDAAALLSTWPKASSDSVLLLGPPDGTIIDTSTDQLLLVDLRSLEGQPLPYPDLTEGSDSIGVQFQLDESGAPYLIDSTDGVDSVLSVYRDGSWTDGPGGVFVQPTVDFELIPPDNQVPRLFAADASGTVLWRRDDITSEPHEGFRTGQSGYVTIAIACVGTYTDFQCDAPALVGVASDTGDTLWLLDGQRAVVAVGNGYALVTDEAPDPSTLAPWILIDTNTGQPIPGQRWDDPATFEQECCGGEEFRFVSRDGGVLVAGHETQLAIWYPADSGLTQHELALP